MGLFMGYAHNDVRKWTNRVLEAMDEGLLDPKAVAEMALAYMSEDEVADMVRVNDLREYLSPEQDEDE